MFPEQFSHNSIRQIITFQKPIESFCLRVRQVKFLTYFFDLVTHILFSIWLIDKFLFLVFPKRSLIQIRGCTVLRASLLLLKRRVIIPQKPVIIDRLAHYRLYSLRSPQILLIKRPQSGLNDPINRTLIYVWKHFRLHVSRRPVHRIWPCLYDHKLLWNSLILVVRTQILVIFSHYRLRPAIIQGLGKHFPFRSRFLSIILKWWIEYFRDI